eukprot:5001482-Karenia_brevis.AAC.1
MATASAHACAGPTSRPLSKSDKRRAKRKVAKEKVAGGMAMEGVEAGAPGGNSDDHGSLQA